MNHNLRTLKGKSPTSQRDCRCIVIIWMQEKWLWCRRMSEFRVSVIYVFAAWVMVYLDLLGNARGLRIHILLVFNSASYRLNMSCNSDTINVKDGYVIENRSQSCDFRLDQNLLLCPDQEMEIINIYLSDLQYNICIYYLFIYWCIWQTLFFPKWLTLESQQSSTISSKIKKNENT